MNIQQSGKAYERYQNLHNLFTDQRKSHTNAQNEATCVVEHFIPAKERLTYPQPDSWCSVNFVCSNSAHDEIFNCVLKRLVY